MTRPRIHGDRVTTVVRLPEDVHRLLQQSALERDVSVNLLITRAVTDYLDRLVPVSELTGPRG
jgi:predicted HicB family RNase H-like nuclease